MASGKLLDLARPELFMATMTETATIEPSEPRPRRRRRTREAVTERIRDAARQLFAERGYAFATTKEIARLADVSETLLFRYYGDKASLFEDVVTAPFNRLMEEFVARHPDPKDPGRDTDARRFVRDVYALFEENREMFRALLFQMPGTIADSLRCCSAASTIFLRSPAPMRPRTAGRGWIIRFRSVSALA